MQTGNAIPMSRRLTLAPVTLALAIGASVLTGSVLGAIAAIALDQPGATGANTVSAPAFDALRFRAGERAPIALAFDEVRFRAGERDPIGAPGAFDPVRFRAEEREPLGR